MIKSKNILSLTDFVSIETLLFNMRKDNVVLNEQNFKEFNDKIITIIEENYFEPNFIQNIEALNTFKFNHSLKNEKLEAYINLYNLIFYTSIRDVKKAKYYFNKVKNITLFDEIYFISRIKLGTMLVSSYNNDKAYILFSEVVSKIINEKKIKKYYLTLILAYCYILRIFIIANRLESINKVLVKIEQLFQLDIPIENIKLYKYCYYFYSFNELEFNYISKKVSTKKTLKQSINLENLIVRENYINNLCDDINFIYIKIAQVYLYCELSDFESSKNILERIKNSSVIKDPRNKSIFTTVKIWYLFKKGDVEKSFKIYNKEKENLVNEFQRNHYYFTQYLQGIVKYFEKKGNYKQLFELNKLRIKLLEKSNLLRNKLSLEIAEIEYRLKVKTEELERKRINNEIKENENLILIRKNEELQNLANVLAHDLETPIRNINDLVELLNTNLSISNGKRTEIINLILHSSDNANLLVSNILSFSKHGNYDKNKEILIFKDVVSSVLIDLQELIKSTNASIIFNLKNKEYIYFNKTALFQVIQNLLKNAIKYTPISRSPIIEISTHTTNNKKFVFSISDNACGLLKEETILIFKPFKRINNWDSKGLGLGLTICKKIIEAHNGRINVKSKLGKGSKFIVEVPKSDI